MNKMRAERAGGASASSDQASAAPANPVQLLTQQIQEQLKSKGLFRGKTDGILGERTIASIRRYQEQQKLPVDGEVSDALLTHLLSTTP
jgi:peptidoglycan hydrolase-like protein with peptidoglycan-binding domain